MSYLQQPSPTYKDPTVMKAGGFQNQGLTGAWISAIHCVLIAVRNTTPPNTPQQSHNTSQFPAVFLATIFLYQVSTQII